MPNLHLPKCCYRSYYSIVRTEATKEDICSVLLDATSLPKDIAALAAEYSLPLLSSEGQDLDVVMMRAQALRKIIDGVDVEDPSVNEPITKEIKELHRHSPLFN